jgi:DnaJ homolog subfamily C member 28
MKNTADKIFDRTIKKDHGIDMQQTLKHIRGHDLVGELIAQAVKRGEFDNLEGAGQPLNLEDNPFEGDLHMVHKILKDNGFAPFWIELGKEIDALRIKFDKDVDYFKRYTGIIGSEKRSSSAIRQYEQRKDSFYTQSRAQLVEISKKILDYNLQCPVAHLHRVNIDVNEQMSSLINEIEALIQK